MLTIRHKSEGIVYFHKVAFFVILRTIKGFTSEK